MEKKKGVSVQQTTITEDAGHAREAVTALTADNHSATRLYLFFIPLLPRHGNLLCFLTILLPGLFLSTSSPLFFSKVKRFSR